jgi:Holliday junction resolvase RusA-like endonuclease
VTTPLQFVVHGEPFSKQRARTTRNGTYTPKVTVKAEASVRAAFQTTHGSHRPTPKGSVAWEIGVTVYRYERHGRDVDNLIKTILDALNGYAWEDDADVETVTHFTTIWVDSRDRAHTMVTIRPTGSQPRPPRRPKPRRANPPAPQ